jgi:hypothetical protein
MTNQSGGRTTRTAVDICDVCILFGCDNNVADVWVEFGCDNISAVSDVLVFSRYITDNQSAGNQSRGAGITSSIIQSWKAVVIITRVITITLQLPG